MNGPIARVLLTLIILLSIRISASAQDDTTTPKKDTNKVVVVVMPGQQYKKPAKRRVAPSTSERSGATYGDDTTYAQPVRTNSADQYSAPTTSERTGYQDYLHPVQHRTNTSSNVGVGVSGISTPVAAPSAGPDLSLGSGTSSSSTTTTTTGKALKVSSTPAAAVPVTGGSVQGGSSTSASTTTTTTTTTTTLPNGQKKVDVKKSDTVIIRKTDTVYIDKQADEKTRSMKAIYAEVGGPGLAISLNYDARFNGERKGLGYRVGAGYFSDNYGNTVFSIPIQVNYLLTKDENNFLELGAGTTFLNSTGNNKGKTFIFDKVTGFIATATIGYRYQPVDHKLNFRIGFVPILYDDGVIWAGGVSIGYNLK